MPDLSVVVSFYNQEIYVEETLRNLAAAADPRIEFLLIDDRSTDATAPALEAAAARHPGMRFHRQPENGGVSRVRNTGVEQSDSTYLAFLDGDDFVSPDYYRQLLDWITALDCDFVRTDHVQVRGKERTVHRSPCTRRGVAIPPRSAILPFGRSTSVDYPYPPTGIYHRRLAERGTLLFDESLRTCEDRHWMWRLHLEAESMATVGLLGFFYRRNVTTSLTQVGDDRQLDFMPAFDDIVNRLMSDPDRDRFLPKAIRSYCALFCFHLKNIDRCEPETASLLRKRTTETLRRLPATELGQVLASFDTIRRSVLTEAMAR